MHPTARKSSARAYPFPFLGHGPAIDTPRFDCFIWFAARPSAAAIKDIVGSVPCPVSAHWDDAAVRLQGRATTPDVSDERAARKALPDWKRFSDKLEAWVKALHARYPLRLVMRASADTWGACSDWHVWSVAQCIPILGERSCDAMLVRVAAYVCAEGAISAGDVPGVSTFLNTALERTAGEDAKDIAHACATFMRRLSPKQLRQALQYLSLLARQRLVVNVDDDVDFFDDDDVAELLAQAVAAMVPVNRKHGAALVRQVVDYMLRFNDVKVVSALGRAVLANQALASDLDALERAVFKKANRNPDNASEQSPSTVLYNLAIQLHVRKKLQAAASLLELALQFPHPIYWAYNNLVLAYFRLRRFEEGGRIADLPLVRDSVGRVCPAIYHNTACVYAALGRTEDALRDIELAIKYDCPSVDRIPRDRDLKSLFEQPRFRALFPEHFAKRSPKAAKTL